MAVSRRMFTAIIPSREALADLEDACRGLHEATPLRLIPISEWHITCLFLAAVPQPALGQLIEALDAAALALQPFWLRIAGSGSFARHGVAHTVWAGVHDEDGTLGELASACRKAAQGAGLRLNKADRYVPHLTLARPKYEMDLSTVLDSLDSYEGPRWYADTLVLFESHLPTRQGERPRYEVVQTFPLGQ